METAMKKNARTGSRLFFIEFLIVLFFFLIISTVCLRLFAKAHLITQRADALSHAQAAAASVAAAVEAGNITPEDAAAVFSDAVVTGDGFTLAYDEAFKPCAAEHAAYTLTLTLNREGQNISSGIVVSRAGQAQAPLYELSAKFHIPLTGEEAMG